jgi:peptide-methionine (R)-S-oxide reductase
MMRRQFLYITAGAAALLSGQSLFRRKDSSAMAAQFEVTKTDAEWKAQLGEEAYQVLRHEATEYAGSSPLNNEKRKGMFHCAGCDLPVYSSEAKYDSGTGWPSFWESMPDAIGTKEDNSFFSTRTECHCRRCGGHFGHIFDDGPPPTGKRHCINGVSLAFKPATAA